MILFVFKSVMFRISDKQSQGKICPRLEKINFALYTLSEQRTKNGLEVIERLT